MRRLDEVLQHMAQAGSNGYAAVHRGQVLAVVGGDAVEDIMHGAPTRAAFWRWLALRVVPHLLGGSLCIALMGADAAVLVGTVAFLAFVIAVADPDLANPRLGYVASRLREEVPVLKGRAFTLVRIPPVV